MTAFRQVVSKLQEGQREEALIGLEFVLRLDPAFAPASNLQRQLQSGASEIDLSGIIGELQAPTTEAINEVLVEAVEDFNQRNFVEAREKVAKVLIELPGHKEGRQLLKQIDDALKVEGQVGQFLAQAREALDRGDPQEAANFVMMAQALDPHHRGIEGALKEIYASSGVVVPQAAPPPTPAPPPAAGDELGFGGGFDQGISFETMNNVGDFAVQFDDVPSSFEPMAGPPSSGPAPRPGRAPQPPPSAPAPVADDGFAVASFDAEPAAAGTALSSGDDDLFTAEDSHSPWDEGASADFSFSPAVTDQVAADDGGQFFQGDEGDISDLFHADADARAGAADRFAGGAADESERIANLLARAQNSYDHGNLDLAISSWSQIFLLDPHHEEAKQRLAEAHQLRDDAERRIEPLLFQAQDAGLGGETERALALLDEILAISPNHLQATQLREGLLSKSEPATAGAVLEAPAVPQLPELDDDLFQDRLSLDDIAAAITAPAEVHKVPKRGSFADVIPWRMLIGGAAALVVVLVGVLVGTRLLSASKEGERAEALNLLLQRSQELFERGQVEEAIHVLREYPVEDIDRPRIERRIEQYEATLAPPTPTPIPQSLIRARELFEESRWLAAYREVSEGLRAHPQDPDLLDLKRRIDDFEPRIADLYNAQSRSSFRAAVGTCDDLLHRHPGNGEFTDSLNRNLFNAALSELRAYNLTGAEHYLKRLEASAPGDEEVDRVLEFIQTYKIRPVDMKLQIFIKNLKER